MIKGVGFFKRKPDLNVEEFQHHWRVRHAPIFVRLPGLRRYAQSHVLLSGYCKREPLYDGVAELWFDDTDAFRRATRSRQYEAVLADRARFMDLERFGLILTDEHVAKDGPTAPEGVKTIAFATRKPDMPVAAFQAYWRDVHGPLGVAIPLLRRYVQSHARPEEYAEGKRPAWDGFAMEWFDSTDAVRRSAALPEYAAVRADEPNFVAPVPAPVLIAKEYVILG